MSGAKPALSKVLNQAPVWNLLQINDEQHCALVALSPRTPNPKPPLPPRSSCECLQQNYAVPQCPKVLPISGAYPVLFLNYICSLSPTLSTSPYCTVLYS